MNYWNVSITIGKEGRFWETAGALVSYLLSQYGGWIGNWETAGDALNVGWKVNNIF